VPQWAEFATLSGKGKRKEQLMTKYAAQMKMVGRVPDALSGAMGNMMYVANFPPRH